MEGLERLQSTRLRSGGRGLEDHRRPLSGSPFVASLVVLTGLLVSLPAKAGTPLDKAQTLLDGGRYADAIAALRAIDSPQARVVLAGALLETGEYESALTLADRLDDAATGGAAAVVAARTEVALGRFAKAIKRLRAELKRRPRNFEARVVLANALRWTGTARRELKEADAVADYWNEGAVTTAQDLAWLGQALHLTEYFKDANEIFFEAREKDPGLVIAHLLHARLFLEKADEAQAGKAVDQALKLNPNHPEALTLTALMDLSSDNDTVKATKNIDAALKVNPRYVPALRAKARVLIETEQFAEAGATLEGAMRINPKDPETLAMLAATHLLREDDKAFESWMKRALKVNKRYAEGYHLVAEFAVRQHRYVDANKLERRAIKLDPEYAPAYVGLGVGLSRVGKDEEANKYLQRAFELDSYNVQAFNMTSGFYDGPVNEMVWKSVGPVRLRAHKAEMPVLERFRPDFLRHAFETHKKKYSFTPKTPLHVEIFPSDEVFAIRTTGYPNLSAHAVCFGQVITSRSPSSGRFNWAMVMWHELAHVWHIQMSRSRVPRWFTEGLAEHETTLARKEWRREMDAELYDAMQAGRLEGIERFNTMFVHAKSIDDILIAYYYASKVVAFIDKTWGFEVFPRMLKAWSRRKSTEAVFQEVLGLSLVEFDAKMSTYLRTDLLARFKDAFAPKEGSGEDPATVAFLAAEKAIAAKGYDEANRQLDIVFDAGRDGVALRLMAGFVAMQQSRWEDARRHLEAGLAIDDQRSELWHSLSSVAGHLSDEALQRKCTYHMAWLEENRVQGALAAHEAALAAKETREALAFAEQAVHIAPFEPTTRMALARASIDVGRFEVAAAELDALEALPASAARVRPTTLLKARLAIARGKKTAAEKLLEGLEAGPDLEEVRELL